MPREGNPVTEKGGAESGRKGTALAERESCAIANRINDCFLVEMQETRDAKCVFCHVFDTFSPTPWKPFAITDYGIDITLP